MKTIYSSPLRVYLCLGLLSLIGIIAGTKLPVSLYPNSSKPTVNVNISYGSSTANEFLKSYGMDIENHLQKITLGSVGVEQIQADYGNFGVTYKVEFQWGAPPKEALKEAQLVMSTFTARMPREMRDSLGIWTWARNSGFLALSFYSQTKSLTELYEILEPILTPHFSKVQDADQVNLWNPENKEVQLEIIPETLAAYHLFPRDIETAVTNAISSQNGGAITIGPKNLLVQMPKQVATLQSIGRILIPTPAGQQVHLSEVAKIDIRATSGHNDSFKTSGVPSIILFATPKAGGNVKRMSEDLIQIVEKALPNLPKDVEFKKLVDPSEFIRNAIDNVSHEVALGAFLAVLVLYLFIGSFKNVGTAAIEIPMSMLMALILMYFSNMNLNIISLGGLALSAGMNVDASVVVMENIFRHFEGIKGKLNYAERLRIVMQAVNEVRFPVIASTIASLVVFLPLAFTSALSYAVLGDLAKTVVFSHGLSAIVALVLVPTVRLQLMGREKVLQHKSPIEKQLTWLENTYANLLQKFMRSPKFQWQAYGALVLILVLLVTLVLPRLPREIIGIPDTDWIVFGIDTNGNSLTRQMESIAEEHEVELLKKYENKIQYTFTQIKGPNKANIMARLKSKNDMIEVWKGIEKIFPNTPFTSYFVVPWNPAELPIPDPPHLRVVVRGGTVKQRAEAANSLKETLQEKQIYPRTWTSPSTSYEENILFQPYRELWALLEQKRVSFTLFDIADLARVATQGRTLGNINLDEKYFNIHMSYPENRIKTLEDLGALPIGVGESLIPLKALGKIELREVPPLIYRENGQDMFLISAKLNKGDESKITPALGEAQKVIDNWLSEHARKNSQEKNTVSVFMEDAAKDMNEAIEQLGLAIGLSILLIFLTMVLQFGGIVNALLVLVAVPLGIIGVILSLYIFQSTLSLNSALGVILLNGIAVANSIILVDFLKRLVESGLEPEVAAITAARKRLRPILITSMTTLLGMLPIALGFGEGGRILQPLGIAVSGGLWFSMGLTLFIVPTLQVTYLHFQRSRKKLRPAAALAAENLATFDLDEPLNPALGLVWEKQGFFSRGLKDSAKDRSDEVKVNHRSNAINRPTDTIQ